MNEVKKNQDIFKSIRITILENLRFILISIGIILLTFIAFQTYSFFSIKELKKTSIEFFNIIENNENIIDNLNKFNDNDKFFSILSDLKIIQKNNNQNNFEFSNQLYKKLIISENLNDIYKSSIAAHASYTLINASYSQNTINYIDSISFYISNINDQLESYTSIKRELEYLLIVTKLDLNKKNYKDNQEVSDLYNEITNSSLVSPSVKERVKKIHEFQLYK